MAGEVDDEPMDEPVDEVERDHAAGGQRFLAPRAATRERKALCVSVVPLHGHVERVGETTYYTFC